jgi:thioredoxin 1
MRKITYHLFLMFTVFFTACNAQPGKVQNLDVDAFDKSISNNQVQLVDVRTPGEFASKHIQNAKNIDINGADFDKQMNSLDKSKPVYIYCLSGGRSSRAAGWALANGFREVYNLSYGINSWLGEKKPVVAENAEAQAAGLTFDDYLKHLSSAQKLVLVDFNAVWCGPCKILKPRIQSLLKKRGEKVELYEIDVDKNSALANKMNVKGIPLLILYKGGKEVWRTMGLAEEKDLMDKVDEFSK